MVDTSSGRRFVPKDPIEIGAPVRRFGQNVASGILQLPAAIPAMVDIARIGIPAVANTITKSTEEMMTNPLPPVEGGDGFMSTQALLGQRGGTDAWQTLGKEFLDGVIDEDSMKAINMLNMMEEDQFKRSNPDATDEELKAHVAAFQDSDEYYDMLQKQMPIGLRTAEWANKKANELVGLDVRPDKQTSADEISQIVGQSLIGLPSSVIRGIQRAAVKTIGESVTKGVAGRVATRTLEAVTPLTLPLTPGNVAVNAVAGSAVNEAIRGAQDRPTLLTPETESVNEEPQLRFPENIPVPIARPDGSTLADTSYSPDANPVISNPVTSLATAVGVFGAMFSVPGVRKAMREGAEAAMKTAEEERVANMSMRAGRTLEEQSTDKLEPQLNSLRGSLDRNTSVTGIVNKFKEPTDTTSVPKVDAIMSQQSAMNNAEAVNNTLNYGVLDGIPNTIPFRDIQRFAQSLAPEEYDLFGKYLFSTMRKQDVDLQTKNLQNEINQNLVSLSNAKARNDTRSITEISDKLTQLQTKYQGSLGDDPSMRPSMEDWSREDINAAIQVGELNPKVAQLHEMFKKVSNDLVEFQKINGTISTEEAASRLSARPVYVKLQEQSYADTTNPIVRAGRRFYDKSTSSTPDHGLYPQTRPRNVSGEGAKVNVLQDPLAAMQRTIVETVEGVHANKSRRDIIDTIRNLPGALNVAIRPIQFDMGNGRKVSSISEAQLTAKLNSGGSLIDQIEAKGDHITKVHRGGKVEFWEWSDAQTARAMQFAPVHTVPFFHATRKMWQRFTTGVGNPLFAPVSLAFDVSAGLTTARAGRSFGYLDTYGRHLLNESALANRVFDMGADPTAYLSSAVSVGTMAVRRAQRAFGHKVASDLINNSGVFATIAQAPGGRKLVTSLGEAAVRSFDNSIHSVMFRNMSMSFGHMFEASTKIQDYKIKASQAGKFAPIWNGYVAMLESIQMGARSSFFSQNYFRMQAKAAKQGKKVSQSEIDLLVRDTKLLAGDLTRVPKNKYVQQATDIIPFGNPILQGTSQMLNAMIPPSVAKGANQFLGTNFMEDRVSYFWTKFAMSHALPAVTMASVWATWPEAEDHLYNKTPYWQQFGSFAFPSAEAIQTKIETGEWPEFNEKYIERIRLAPELAPLVSGTLAGLRELGIIGSPPAVIDRSFLGDLKQSFLQMSSLVVPPIAKAALIGSDMAGLTTDAMDMVTDTSDLPKEGANSGSLTYNSVVSQQMFELVGAIFGSVGKIAATTFDIGQKAYDDTGWMDGIQKASEVAGFEAKRRLPQTSSTGLYNSRERLFASTPESTYKYATERALAPIIGQHTIEIDRGKQIEALRNAGYSMVAKIKSPALKRLSETVYDTINKKGPYKDGDKAYTQLRLELNALESTRHKIAQDKYDEQRNEIVGKQQDIIRQQAAILRQLENSLAQKIGAPFQQKYGTPFTLEALGKAVQEDTSQ